MQCKVGSFRKAHYTVWPLNLSINLFFCRDFTIAYFPLVRMLAAVETCHVDVLHNHHTENPVMSQTLWMRSVMMLAL